jgi:hypothetical protein
MKKIENILKLIPMFSFLLIVASSVKLAIFYKTFNINIIDYLGISEYIPLFLDDLHSLLYIGSIILFFLIKPPALQVVMFFWLCLSLLYGQI